MIKKSGIKARRLAREATRSIAVLAVSVVIGGGWAGARAQEEPKRERPARTSETDETYRRVLEQFPQADTDRDGILTHEEAQAFRPKYEEWKRQADERRAKEQRDRPKPAHADVKYGPHERNVFDLWLPGGASPEKPLPVFVFFHGGGFVAGDKSQFNPAEYLRQGYAVMAANYRFVNGKDVLSPVPMEDCARALQYLRFKAKEFGIDPSRVALSGGSAGAVITMWIAFKNDLAKPESADPVERQSTRVSCIVPTSGPTNLDPEWIRQNMGGPPEVHNSLPLFFGVPDGNFSSPEVRALIQESSVIHHATADDPPAMLLYRGEVDNLPLPLTASQGLLIHHPYFGKILKDKLDKLGVECELRHGGREAGPNEVAAFLAKHLKKAPEKGKGTSMDPAKRAQAIRDICKRLSIGQGSAVADVGCGKTGPDTMTFAEVVGPSGKVYAGEIEQGMLDAVARKAKERGFDQVVTVLGASEDPQLPDAALDLISMHIVFHHFAKPQSMLANFWKDLKPGGHLVIIDRERGPQREWVEMASREKKHSWTGETTVVRLAREAGFLFRDALDGVWPESKSFVLVFQKPQDVPSPAGDPDLPAPLDGSKLISHLPDIPGSAPKVLFLGIDRGRAALPALREKIGAEGRILDVVLEEWRTFQDEVPAGAASGSGEIVRTAKGDLPDLQPGSLDAAVFADGFSRLWDPAPLLRRLHTALVPGAFFAILDRKGPDDEPRVLAGHRRRVAPERVKSDLEAAGFECVRELDPPAEDRFFLVFQKRRAPR